MICLTNKLDKVFQYKLHFFICKKRNIYLFDKKNHNKVKICYVCHVFKLEIFLAFCLIRNLNNLI